MRCALIAPILMAALAMMTDGTFAAAADRPNILFCIADDWGWPHAGAYGDEVVQTPNFDRVAADGVLFHHAFVSSPSCTPSRGAILTGQFHWRLKGAANLWSVFPDEFAVYPEALAAAGYRIGRTGKAWGPGRTESPSRVLAGPGFKNFEQFLADQPDDAPFCFWLGTSDPHRPYKAGSGEESGMVLSKVHLFGCFPDDRVVRSDVADYYWEVQRWDRLVGDALEQLDQRGLRDNTIIVITGDHGMPFPRCKSNLYDSGTRVPLAISWPARVPSGREVTDFMSLTDLAPTFLEAAGVERLDGMTGRSLMPVLTSDRDGRVDPQRGLVLFGKERHVPSQEAPDMGGYPGRAIRTDTHLYIRNFTPDRWPNGTPNYTEATLPGTWYGDTDNGPTKTFIVERRDTPEGRRYWDWSFGFRPEVELYDLTKDPEQLTNVAGHPDYAQVQERLDRRLMMALKNWADPRAAGEGEFFSDFPYLGGGPKHPDWQRQ